MIKKLILGRENAYDYHANLGYEYRAMTPNHQKN